MLDNLLRLMDWLIRLAKLRARPIKAELLALDFCESKNRPDDLIVFVTAYPRAYAATLQLTNRNTDNAVYLKAATLTVDEEYTYPAANMDICPPLQPAGLRDEGLTFPVPNEDAPPQAGSYRIEIVPAIGRTTRLRGTFPL